MSFNMNFPFTTPSNYTPSDANKIEVANNRGKLKPFLTFYANYNSNINGTRGLGILAGSSFGSAGVVGGELDLAHSDIRGVDYSAVENADGQQIITIRLKDFKPQYITPVGESVIFCIGKQSGSNINLIYYRDTGSHHRLHIQDKNGVLIEECIFGYKQWIVDNPYEIEFGINITTGATRMFIDGLQFGATKTGTGLRDGDIGLLRVGSNKDKTTISNFKLGDIVVFDEIKHTANYTPGESILATLYHVDNPYLEINESIRTDQLIDFLHTVIALGLDAIQWILKKDSTWMWWSGSAWVISNETYAQTSSSTDILANIAAFTALGVDVKFRCYLHSDDGSTTPEIDNLYIEYDFAGVAPTLQTTKVWGYTRNRDGTKNPSASVKVQMGFEVDGSVAFSSTEISVTSDANAYWEIDIKYVNNLPSILKWDINDDIFKTNSKSGTNEIGDLDILI